MLPLSFTGAYGKWYFQIVPSAEFAVDSFFLISAFLVTYQSLQRIRKRMTEARSCGLRAALHSMHVPSMLVHRWLRLVPALLGMMLLMTYVAPLLSTGPMWNVRHVGCAEWAAGRYDEDGG